MSESQFHLLRTTRFLPLFATQFLGALNDNVFKNALVVLIIYRIAAAAGMNGQVLVTLAAGIFILPFFLFSATAGQIADKFEKSGLIRWIKAAEVAVISVGAAAIWQGDVYLMLGVLFLMGTQSAFFGPVKYSILPDHLSEDELIGGNALVEAGTFLAILVGTIAGGLLILRDHGALMVSAGVVMLAISGLCTSWAIPRAPAPAPALAINPNVFGETWAIVRRSAERRDIFLSILGISWFWLVGATFLAQFPALAKDVLSADETVVTLFLTLFSMGIGLGSLLCNTLLKGEISAKYVPLGALGMTVFIVDLFMASSGDRPAGGPLVDAVDFLAAPGSWRIVLDLVAISVSGGLYIVPLYAILQSRSEETHRSRVIAANNIMNALFMVLGALAATAMLAGSVSVPGVFLTLAVVNGVVAVYICRLLPDAVIKAVLAGLLTLCYRVRVRGLESYADAGPRAVIVVNHVSFLDAVLLAAFLPGKPMFAVDTRSAGAWWLRPLLGLVDAFPLDPTHPMATKSLIKAVRKGLHCVIFPEGRITVTGSLMRIYEGPGMVADKADAMLVPVRIDGAQYSPFSRLRGKVRIRWFPRITITLLPPRRFEIPEGVVGRARRRRAGLRLYDVMSEMMFETWDHRQSLFEALLDAAAVHGHAMPVVEDVERKPLTYGRLTLAALTLGRKLAALSRPGEYVGVMLPSSVGAAVTFFALQAFGRVPAMLNFSTGARIMNSAITAAGIVTVLTSRRFVKVAGLEATVEALGERVRVAYIEDLRRDVSLQDTVWALISRPFARRAHRRLGIAPDDPAVVLFTSGSEGTPKGVVLSHANLLANRYQLAARVDFNRTDIVFNALPVFHSFGLTGGTLLPILSGIKTFLYPSPLHYRIVPALIYESNATILFGTDTFLAGYARVADPYDLYSVRYVFAGAERVKEETRRTWAEKFGLRILEGYGATETSPVLAVNTPMHFRAGTVGRFIPGTDYTLVPVPGLERGGRLIVSGPNVMLGYLRSENPGVLERPEGRRYDTGDIVSVDEEGFVTIEGRAKRFAKIAGEMVSLGAVEGYADAVWPGSMHAVISVADAQKGERLVLVTDREGAQREALLAYAKANGITELMVPRTIRVLDTLPVLGTGKVDYAGVKVLIEGAPEPREGETGRPER